MYLWLVFVHVLSGFIFFLSHGAAAFMLLKLPNEREPERIKALLDLRIFADPWMSWSAGVLFLSGIAAGFMGGWWDQGWIWTSLVLLILVSVVMTFMGRMYFERVRKALGLENRLPGTKPGKIENPVGVKELEAVIAAGNPRLVTAVGLIGLAIIVYLMMFKPF